MRYLILSFSSLLIITLSVLQAQNNDPSLLISGYAALPTGDFGKDIGENAHITRRAGFDIGDYVGLAQNGFGAGAELYTPLALRGVDWIISARVLTNRTDVSAIENTFEFQLGDTIDLQFEFGNWINIPVMTGIRYGYSLMPGVDIFGFIQVGINITQAAARKAVRPEITVKYRYPDNTVVDTTFYDYPVEETTFKYSRDFGFEVGCGVELFRKFNVGVRYLALNTPRYQGTRKLSEYQFRNIFSRETVILGEPRRVSMFLISLGFYLF